MNVQARLTLLALPGVNRRIVRHLCENGADDPATPEAFRAVVEKARGRFPYLAVPERAAAARAGAVAAKQVEASEKLGVRILAPEIVAPQLAGIPDAPVVLFAKGNHGVLWHHAVAVVGTREPTKKGRERAREIGGRLASRGITVVSGLARGCDTASKPRERAAPCTPPVFASSCERGESGFSALESAGWWVPLREIFAGNGGGWIVTKKQFGFSTA